MKKSIVIATTVVFVVAGLALGPSPAEAQKKGQSAKIQHGIVVKSERVDLSDNKTTQGAVVGGTIGLMTGRSSGYKRRRNAAIGAAAGGLLGAAGSTQQMGMMYTVEIAGGVIKVVTDQTEIHMGDCVVVEETSQGARPGGGRGGGRPPGRVPGGGGRVRRRARGVGGGKDRRRVRPRADEGGYSLQRLTPLQF